MVGPLLRGLPGAHQGRGPGPSPAADRSRSGDLRSAGEPAVRLRAVRYGSSGHLLLLLRAGRPRAPAVRARAGPAGGAGLLLLPRLRRRQGRRGRGASDRRLSPGDPTGALRLPAPIVRRARAPAVRPPPEIPGAGASPPGGHSPARL